jgi:hypothetical protein
MRLLNTETLKLEQFYDAQVPPYNILSHTWGAEEVTFQDLQSNPDFRAKAGWKKIEGFIECAKTSVVNHNGFNSCDLTYVWVDTCCIDKTSSAELSEAINSMFQYYCDAVLCIAYLSDFEHDLPKAVDDMFPGLDDLLQKCRWFTRGWTLQELVAPKWVQFCDAKWRFLGFKSPLDPELKSAMTARSGISPNTNHRCINSDLAHITRIPVDVLSAPMGYTSSYMYRNLSVAQRMSWAAERVTSRREDIAYCLLGIFGVNMPLLYGEGDRAFQRLQEEISKNTEDETIFAWGFDIVVDLLDPAERNPTSTLFAPAPSWFRCCGNLQIPKEAFLSNVAKRIGLDANSLSLAARAPSMMTNRGLRIDLPCFTAPSQPDTIFAILQAFEDGGNAHGDPTRYGKTRESAPLKTPLVVLPLVFDGERPREAEIMFRKEYAVPWQYDFGNFDADSGPQVKLKSIYIKKVHQPDVVDKFVFFELRNSPDHLYLGPLLSSIYVVVEWMKYEHVVPFKSSKSLGHGTYALEMHWDMPKSVTLLLWKREGAQEEENSPGQTTFRWPDYLRLTVAWCENPDRSITLIRLCEPDFEGRNHAANDRLLARRPGTFIITLSHCGHRHLMFCDAHCASKLFEDVTIKEKWHWVEMGDHRDHFGYNAPARIVRWILELEPSLKQTQAI